MKAVVVRDAEWHEIFSYTVGDQEYKERMANMVWRVRRVTEKEVQNKKNRSTKFIDKVVPLAPAQRIITTCQAVNMNNKPCQFKATCGKFCKKHKVEVGAVFGKEAPKINFLELEEED